MYKPRSQPISRGKILWAYSSEILLVTVVQTLIQLVWGTRPVMEFVLRTAKDWAQLAGILLAAALVIWGMYVNFTTSSFGDYLRWSGREAKYRNAFSMAIFVPSLSAILLIIASGVPIGVVHQAAMAAMLYTLASIYTMYRNIVSLSSRKREFDELLAREVQSENSPEA